MSQQDFSLMIHGGAGALDHVRDAKEAVKYLDSMRVILEHGRQVMKQGGSALQAVEACAALLEDDPLYNAGCGSVLNENGRVEMDAAIMDGKTLKAGAVAAIHNVANPVMLARKVMAHSEHVMLIGAGAMKFAEAQGTEMVPDTYFITEQRLKQFKQIAATGQIMLDHETVQRLDQSLDGQKYGTIGAVARDSDGNLAAATSTGGIVNKKFGRVGDSPIVGSGVYADNQTCAVSATGYGEDFMRTVLAKTVADLMDFKGLSGPEATQQAIEYLERKVKGRGGIIVIDKDGYCASRYTTNKMIHGWIEKGGEAHCCFSQHAG